jgi:hypothetical protein
MGTKMWHLLSYLSHLSLAFILVALFQFFIYQNERINISYFAACIMLVSCLTYTAVMKTEIFPSEMSVDFRRTIQCYLPEDVYIFACHLVSRWFLDRLIIPPWRWKQYVSLERQLTFIGLHSVISERMSFFLRSFLLQYCSLLFQAQAPANA